MKDPLSAALVVAAPSFGPALVLVFGVRVPILALGLSIAALLLARWVAPPPLRSLSRKEQFALTLLLLIFLFLIVTGQMPLVSNGEPLGVGMAVVVGAGLGMSGLFAVEMAEKRFRAMLNAAFGTSDEPR